MLEQGLIYTVAICAFTFVDITTLAIIAFIEGDK